MVEPYLFVTLVCRATEALEQNLGNKLDTGLRTLLGPGKLIARYQPIVNLSGGEILGCEILARWLQPSGVEIGPSAFVQPLEASGLIEDLTPCLLAQAFRTCEDLPSSFGLSLNVSPLQLRTDVLPGQIEDLGRLFGFDLSRLTVEITESAYLENLEQAGAILARLKDFGVKVSLDDFGTGYSSLTHLHALPFDEVKIDQSFVSSMTQRRQSRKIVAAVIGLGRSLGLATVAEGVEHSDQADMLRCLGCERAQGWLFGRPLAGECLRSLVLDRPSEPGVEQCAVASTSAGRVCLEALPLSNHAQLQAIYEGAPVGLCFLDCEDRFVSLNLHLAEMNGYAVQDHLGKTLQQLAPDTFEVVKAYLGRAKTGEAIRDVEVSFSSGDNPRVLLLSFQPAIDEVGEVIGVSIVTMDITSRKLAEEKLREREAHYRNMVELNPQIPWTLDTNGFVTEVSPRWREFTGQEEAEAHGVGWLKALHPSDVEPTAAVLAEALATSLPSPCSTAFKRPRTPGTG